jgi:hypothetical protein
MKHASQGLLNSVWKITNPTLSTRIKACVDITKPKPLSVAPPPPLRVDASSATMDGSSLAGPRPSPIDPFVISAPLPSAIRLDLNGALCSLSNFANELCSLCNFAWLGNLYDVLLD